MEQKPTDNANSYAKLGFISAFAGLGILVIVIASRFVGATVHAMWAATIFVHGPQISFIIAILGLLITYVPGTSSNNTAIQESTKNDSVTIVAIPKVAAVQPSKYQQQTRRFALDVASASLILIFFTWAPTPLKNIGVVYAKTQLPTATPSPKFITLEQATFAPINTTAIPSIQAGYGTPIILPTFIPYTPTPIPAIPDTPVPVIGNTPTSTAVSKSTPTATSTSVATPTNTPVPTATNTPVPVYKFAIAPQSVVQTCASKSTSLAGTGITLDNSHSTGSVNWQLVVTERDSSNHVWASGSQTSGTVNAGQVAGMKLIPYTKLCSDLVAHSVVTFHATFNFTGGQSVVSDTITTP